MNKLPSIGHAELEILHYITDRHPVTVRQVADHVAATKGHVRTTVLNVMERLRKKKYLTRQRVDGVYQYSPSRSKPELLRTLVQNFVETALEGSLSPFAAYLAGRMDLSGRQRRDLRQLARELENKPVEQQ
jgi:BlaI family penicillinase repressor